MTDYSRVLLQVLTPRQTWQDDVHGRLAGVYIASRIESTSTETSLFHSMSASTSEPRFLQTPDGLTVVPLYKCMHSSKWNQTVNEAWDPFTVVFNTKGKERGYGVSHVDLMSFSPFTMTGLIEQGGSLVYFPGVNQYIRFRIVVSYTTYLPLVDVSADHYIPLRCSGRGIILSNLLCK